MRTLTCMALVVFAMSWATVVQAGHPCRVVRACDSPSVVVLPSYPVVLLPACPPVYRPARVCTPYTPARGVVRAPRMMAQPGYWVQQDLGCGRSRRLWQPSRATPRYPTCPPVIVSRW